MLPPTVRVVVPSRPAAARCGVDLGQRARQLLQRVVHRQPAVADQRGAALGRRAVATDEQAGLRLLHRLGVEHHRREVEELAVVLDHVLRPEATADVDGLVDPTAAGVEVEAGDLPLLLQPAGADAELDPTARDHVERGDGARGDERVAQPDVVDVGAEAHVLRGRRDRSQRHAARRTRACSTGSADASRRRAGCPSSPPGTPGAPATTPTRTLRPRRPAPPSSRTSC